MSNMRKITGYWLPVFAWMSIIFYLSSRSSFPVEMPSWAIAGDKVVHIIIYGTLGFLFLRAWILGDWTLWTVKSAVITVLFTTCYGMTDEFHQLFVPGRDCSVSDLMADSIGGILAGLSVYLYGKQFKRWAKSEA